MGFLKLKYTKEYFLGMDAYGNKLNYGALGAEEWTQGGIFHDTKQSLDLVEYEGKKVLEIGYGRCESGRYLLKYNIIYYYGIDFSEAAFELASKALESFDHNRYSLVTDDALEHMKKLKCVDEFDVVIMLDTLEHIPNSEVKELLPLLYAATRIHGYLIVNTPFYNVDEDYIKQGYEYIEPSLSDRIEETKGMHCNKFTKRRLKRELSNAGFMNISDRLFQKQMQ